MHDDDLWEWERYDNLLQRQELADQQLLGYLELLQEQAVLVESLEREVWHWKAVCYSVLSSRKPTWLSGKEREYLEQLEQEREREKG